MENRLRSSQISLTVVLGTEKHFKEVRLEIFRKIDVSF